MLDGTPFPGSASRSAVDRLDTRQGIRAGPGGATASFSHAADPFRLLALLDKAKQALVDDPVRAHHYIDHASHLVSQGRPGRPSCPELLTARRPAYRPPATGGLAGWQARKVIDHIDCHLADSLPADRLAAIANVSTGHFCRGFKVSIGETPHAFIMRQRVRRAQIMMLETDSSLSLIASTCGLADQAHLTRLFKRLVGATPLVWRRSWQDGGTDLPASPCA